MLYKFYFNIFFLKNNILFFRKFISMLPDKGEKIIAFQDKLLNVLNNQKEIDKAAVLLSRLNIASEGKAAMNELEWTGSYPEEVHKNKIIELDSDDEEDPLKILAQVSSIQPYLQEDRYFYQYLYNNSLQELVYIRRKLYIYNQWSH